MIEQTWMLSGLEFVGLWGSGRGHRLPEPFYFTCRIPLWADYLSAKDAARNEVRARLGGAFDEVLDIVAKPDIQIVATARYPSGTSSIRLRAARRGSRAFLLQQMPREEWEESARFRFDELSVLDLSAEIVRRLPSAPAGRLGRVDLSVYRDDQLDHEYGRSVAREPQEDPEWSRAEHFLKSPVELFGSMVISQGMSRFGPRQRAQAVGIGWRDLADDGRYVLADKDMSTAVGADAVRFATAIDGGTATLVQAIKDERR